MDVPAGVSLMGKEKFDSFTDDEVLTIAIALEHITYNRIVNCLENGRGCYDAVKSIRDLVPDLMSAYFAVLAVAKVEALPLVANEVL